MARTKVTQKKVSLSDLNNHNITNKRQALKDLKMLNFDEIQFKNPAQKRFYKTISSKDITFGIGPAGCGKTYLSVHKALRELGDKNSKIDGIVIVKPLVEAAGEKIGFLPGDVEEKTLPFMMSFYYNMEQIIGKQRLNILKESNTIQVIPMAYMRGITLANKFVILDEAQNATHTQIKMFLTRCGKNSRMVVTGDPSQIDLNRKSNSGLIKSIKILEKIDNIEVVELGSKDIVRDEMVTKIINAYDSYDDRIKDLFDQKS